MFDPDPDRLHDDDDDDDDDDDVHYKKDNSAVKCNSQLHHLPLLSFPQSIQ